jgi:hypothetical protein
MNALWRFDPRCWSIGVNMQTVRGIDNHYRFWLGLHFLCWSVALLVREWEAEDAAREGGEG